MRTQEYLVEARENHEIATPKPREVYTWVNVYEDDGTWDLRGIFMVVREVKEDRVMIWEMDLVEGGDFLSEETFDSFFDNVGNLVKSMRRGGWVRVGQET